MVDVVLVKGYFRGKIEIQLNILVKMNKTKLLIKSNRMRRIMSSNFLPTMKNDNSRF